MLKFGNKEFRNLQEQVLANMRAIGALKTTGLVLDEFGIKVIGQADTVAEMPTVESYKEDNPDWAYGDAYAIGTTEPYTLYILTRANEAHPADFWFDIGEFPAVGPQGPQGPQGETGPQGQTGNPGADGLSAGFGSVTATATTLTPGSDATVSVTASGPNTAKEFSFTFGIPEGEPGVAPELEWGNISGDLADQADLVSALQAKQNKLVSGTNIKTINNESILGSGNIVIQGGGGDVTDVKVNGVSVVDQDGVAKVTVPTKTSDLTNNSGFITGITSSDVTTALGYTPGTSNFSGAYADLTGKPDLSVYAETSDLAAVAFSGSYTDLSNKPTIPTKTSDLTNDSGFITASYHDATKQDVISDLATIRSGAALGATAVQPAALSDYVTKAGGTAQSPEVITGVKSFIDTIFVEYIQCPDTINTVTLEAAELVPQHTSYSISLPDKSGIMALTSDIPTATSDLTNDSGFITSSALSNYVTINTNQNITGDKAFEGSVSLYNADGQIVLHNTTTQGQTHITSAPDSSHNNLIALPDASGTIALTSDVPTKTSDLTNDSGFVTASAVPTKTSDLTNDSGFVTASALSSGYVTTNTAQTITGPKTFSNATVDDFIVSNSSGGFTLYNTTTSYGHDILSNATDDRTITLPDKSGTVAMTSDIPTVPTHISAFINDVGYLLPSAISNMVTTDGGTAQDPQVITGVKTFDTINATSVQASSLVYGPNVKCGNLLNSSNNVISLPSSAGTLALTSDIPTAVSDLTNDSGYITGITSAMVTTALGYTPLQSVTPTSETWTFTLSDGTTTTKTIITAVTSA